MIWLTLRGYFIGIEHSFVEGIQPWTLGTIGDMIDKWWVVDEGLQPWLP